MVQATQDPLGAYTTYQFDGVGNAVVRVDARNWPTTYTVDSLNRVTGWAYLDGTRCTFTFDPDGRQLTMLDVTGITTTTYDTLGRATAVMNPTGVPITFTFDCLGNQIETSMTSYYDTKFTYDAQSRVVGLRNVYGERTTLTYDGLDRETQRVLGNSVAISKSYDAAGREMLISSPVAVYTATYDAVGNRLTVAELDGTLVTYSYDSSYQLTREQRSGATAIDESFVYDGLGNRLTKTDTTGITTCTYNAANAVIASTAPSGVITTSSYDANGNLTLENAGGALTTYAWDGDNHLTLASAAGNVQTNTYSADGMRFERKVNGTSRRYVRNGQNVRGEIKTNAGCDLLHEDLPGIWGAKFAMRWNGGSYYVVPDFQGNTRFLLDSAGAVTDSLITDAWGVELARTGSLETPFLAFGQWGYFRDTASRLYVRARHLRVDQGRWVSRDPIGFGGGAWNVYGYAGGRPVSRQDPSGQQHGEFPCCSDPATGCYMDRHYEGIGGLTYWCCGLQRDSYTDMDSTVRGSLGEQGSCYRSARYSSRQILDALTLLLVCIAECESDWDTHCQGKSERGQLWGYFQLEEDEYRRCTDSNPPRPMCSTRGNTLAAINKLISHCKSPQGTAAGAITAMFACASSRPENRKSLNKTKKCIREHGNGMTFDRLIDILSTVSCGGCSQPSSCY